MKAVSALLAACLCTSAALAAPKTGEVIEVHRPIIVCTSLDDVLVIASAVLNDGPGGIDKTLPQLTEQKKCFGLPGIPIPLTVGEVEPVGKFRMGADQKMMHGVEVWNADKPETKVWLLTFEDVPGAGV